MRFSELVLPHPRVTRKHRIHQRMNNHQYNILHMQQIPKPEAHDPPLIPPRPVHSSLNLKTKVVLGISIVMKNTYPV